MMRIPYSRLACSDTILFATRGGQIHAFNLPLGGCPISIWSHPNSLGEINSTQPSADLDGNAGASVAEHAEPPTKKQRLDSAAKPEEDGEQKEDDGEGTVTGNSKPQGKRGQNTKNHKRGSKAHRASISRRQDFHIITLLATTKDGKHVVAVSGHDKALRVFSHDGAGNLTEQSKR